MNEPEIKKIGQNFYKVAPLAAGKSTKGLSRCLRLAKEGGLQSLMTASDEDLEYFQDMFKGSSYVSLDGGTKYQLVKDVFELHFQKNLTEYTGWLFFCVEVNWGGFFADIAAKAREAEAAEKAESPSVSPTEKSGSSGG